MGRPTDKCPNAEIGKKEKTDGLLRIGGNVETLRYWAFWKKETERTQRQWNSKSEKKKAASIG